MKFASLGSGSEGNGLLVTTASRPASSDATTILIDCGFGTRETERRLARLGVSPRSLSAILVTHEHKDHVGGVFKFARRHDTPVWLTHGTYRAVAAQAEGSRCHFCRDGEPIVIGNLLAMPYTVPHDAGEPVQFTVSDGLRKLGVLTDAGQSTPHLVSALHGCDALVVECNHDRQLLQDSDYPASLKRRIGGPYGHLSNDTAAGILKALDLSRLSVLIAAHLSKQNNTPVLAHDALAPAIDPSKTRIIVACQEEGFDWIDLAPVLPIKPDAAH
ncbi:MAG: MBL fold metallo-hydrolase [Burkholderiaceae bacterium]